MHMFTISMLIFVSSRASIYRKIMCLSDRFSHVANIPVGLVTMIASQ